MFCCLFVVKPIMVYRSQFKITSQMYTIELAQADSSEYSKLAGKVSRVVCIWTLGSHLSYNFKDTFRLCAILLKILFLIVLIGQNGFYDTAQFHKINIVEDCHVHCMISLILSLYLMFVFVKSSYLFIYIYIFIYLLTSLHHNYC